MKLALMLLSLLMLICPVFAADSGPTITCLYIGSSPFIPGASPLGDAYAANFRPYVMVGVSSEDKAAVAFLVTLTYLDESGETRTLSNVVLRSEPAPHWTSFSTGKASIKSVIAVPLAPSGKSSQTTF